MPAQSAIRELLTSENCSPASDYFLAPSVVLVRAWDDTSRLLDFGGHFFGLPPVSTDLLAVTLRRGSGQAVREIADRYGVPQQQVKADLELFLTDLEKRGLVLRQSGRCQGRGYLAKFIERLNVGLIRVVLGRGAVGYRRLWALQALAQLHIWVLGWASTMKIWKAATERSAPRGSISQNAVIEGISQDVRKAAARHILPVDCKVRSLSSSALLRWAGAPARLLVGVDLFPFVGHCWCQSGDIVVGQRATTLARFIPVLCYE